MIRVNVKGDQLVTQQNGSIRVSRKKGSIRVSKKKDPLGSVLKEPVRIMANCTSQYPSKRAHTVRVG